LKYGFKEIDSILFPCRFTNILGRTLSGTFFSFDKALSCEGLVEISYYFVQPKLRIGQPYLRTVR
jgi:hypothetical protein